MEQKKTEYTRKELYELVWEKPFTTIAKEYNISDNGLRKICKKYKIPYPKNGYWAKIKYGAKIKKDKYNEIEEWKDKLFRLEEREAYEDSYKYKLHNLIDKIKNENNKYLEVPERLLNPDPLTKKLRDSYRDKTKGLYNYSSYELLNVIVYSKETIKRALILIDTIIKLLKKNGHEVIVKNGKTFFVIDNLELEISIRELNKRVKIEDTKYSFMNSELIPTGKLSLRMGFRYYDEKVFNDGRKKIEERITEIYAKSLLLVETQKIEIERLKLYWEEQERNRIIELKKKAELEKIKQKNEMLNQDAIIWEKSKNIAEMIQHIEYLKSKNKENNAKIDEWLEWAKKRLSEIDIFQNGLDSFVSKYDIVIDIGAS